MLKPLEHRTGGEKLTHGVLALSRCFVHMMHDGYVIIPIVVATVVVVRIAFSGCCILGVRNDWRALAVVDAASAVRGATHRGSHDGRIVGGVVCW